MKKSFKIPVLIFFATSFLLSVCLIWQNEMNNRSLIFRRREELCRLSGMLNTLAAQIESNDISSALATDEIILQSGYVNALSKRNRDSVYHFLSLLRGDYKYNNASLSAYTRRCAHCAAAEITDTSFLLPYYADVSDISHTSRFIYGAVGSNYYSVVEDNDRLCLYKGNVYSINTTNNDGEGDAYEEYVSLIGERIAGPEFDSVVELYSDADVTFYLGEINGVKMLIGKNTAGRVNYYKKIY